MEDNNNLKLYHAQMDAFISGIDEFVVAQNEEQVRDIIYSKYGGKNGGYSKKDIGVYEVTVEGYAIQLLPNKN